MGDFARQQNPDAQGQLLQALLQMQQDATRQQPNQKPEPYQDKIRATEVPRWGGVPLAAARSALHFPTLTAESDAVRMATMFAKFMGLNDPLSAVDGPVQAMGIIGKAKAFDPSDLERFANTVKDKHGLAQFNVYHKKSTGDIVLSDIAVPKANQKQGIGSAAMEELTQYADEHGKRVILTPALKDDKHGTTSRGRLVEFYKRFGFVENKGRKKDFTIIEGMYRDPKANR